MSVRPVQDQLNWIGNRLIRQAYNVKQKGIYFVFLLFCLLTKKQGAGGTAPRYALFVHAPECV